MDPFKPYQPRPKAGQSLLSAEDADVVAFKAITFIASDEVLLSRFLDLTGCVPEKMAARLHDRGYLGAVLDFILGDEATTIAFAKAAGLGPEIPGLARGLLP